MVHSFLMCDAIGGNSMIIRLAEDKDIRAMAQIRSDEWGDECFWTERITWYRRGEHSPQQALPERTIFVAEEEGHIVGFASGHRTRRFNCDGELQWLNVASHRRGVGIADQLISRMGAWFIEHHAKRICVNVASDNVVAQRMYVRCGAKALAENWMVWEDASLMGRDDLNGPGAAT